MQCPRLNEWSPGTVLVMHLHAFVSFVELGYSLLRSESYQHYCSNSKNSSTPRSSRSSKYLAVVQSPSGWPRTRLQWCTDAAPSSQSQTWTENKHTHKADVNGQLTLKTFKIDSVQVGPWLCWKSVTMNLLKFFLLNVQHGLDPPHHLPKWLALGGEGWESREETTKQTQSMK